MQGDNHAIKQSRLFSELLHKVHTWVYCDPLLQILLDPDPDPLVRGMDPDPVPSKSKKQKNFFFSIGFKLASWRSMTKIARSRSASGSISQQIRIHTKMSWIPNTAVTRVSDPHWFNADPDTDPDPAFFLIVDPVSGSGSRIRIPDPDPGFDDLKLKKIYN